MERGDRILEFVRESGRHFPETFQIAFECDLLPQLGHFSDVSQKAKCASRSAIGRKIDRSDRPAKATRSAVGSDCLNYFAAINFARLETLFNHLGQLRNISQK